MKKQTSNTRISAIPIFTKIVRESHQHVLDTEARLKKLEKEISKTNGEAQTRSLLEEIQSLENTLIEQTFITIVFSAMAVEAYIYDYAARHLSDAFTRDHLDKLDTVSKWVIIPALVTGNELPGRESWLGPLKDLIKTRNSIIHHKSSEPPARSQQAKTYLEKLAKSEKSILDTAKQSITLLDLLADKISDIDPEETPWVRSYLS